MARLARLNGILAVAGIVASTTTPAFAQARVTPAAQLQQARLSLGSIQGSVIDDRGGPLAGAMVSALGAANGIATTDAHGRFVIQYLPSGDYILRIHLAGFATTRRENIRVGPAPATLEKIQLRRLEDASLATPTVPAAGVLPIDESPADEGDNHTETAWRLRHIKRSVLKQDGDVLAIADAASEEPVPPAPRAPFGPPSPSPRTVFP